MLELRRVTASHPLAKHPAITSSNVSEQDLQITSNWLDRDVITSNLSENAPKPSRVQIIAYNHETLWLLPRIVTVSQRPEHCHSVLPPILGVDVDHVSLLVRLGVSDQR